MPVSLTEGRHGVLEVRWEQGRLVLNSGHANQSFGSLHRVWQQVLKDVLVEFRPANVLVLGMGGGSVLQILRKEHGLTVPITAVEIDPHVIGLARKHFGIAALEGLQDRKSVV